MDLVDVLFRLKERICSAETLALVCEERVADDAADDKLSRWSRPDEDRSR